tara:strand:- start:1403 stop:2407 length:1005 start_codon:yes stop_codon:yes gene_type:complete
LYPEFIEIGVNDSMLLEGPKALVNAKDNDLLHVFLINGPVTSIVSRMIIDTYDLKENTFFIVCSRKTDTSIFNLLPFSPDHYWYDNYFEKIFSFSFKGLRILNKILEKKKNFILYSAWAELESEKIIASKYCKGHIYFEEGQMAYWEIKPFQYKREFIISRTIKNIYLHLTNSYVRFSENHEKHYRDDALAFMGITAKAFPKVPRERRYILDNYSTLKKHYKPKLLGVKTIGLTCAERRIQPPQWASMLKTLVESMPEGGVIKLHPSFSTDKQKVGRMKSLLKLINANNVKVCDDDIIIEIEMLYEQKKLIGPLTSLSIYADAFGSKFEEIKLY